MTIAAGGRLRGRRFIPLVVLLMGAFVLGACGAPPYTYVTNSADHTYLKVPSSWGQIDTNTLASGLGFPGSAQDRGMWLQGYDADNPPSADHLLGPAATAPAVMVAVQDVPAEIRGKVSLDLLRDFFFPVSASRRQSEAMDPTSPFSGFQLVSDETLAPSKGIRGVHDVFIYSIAGGPSQVFDQTMYANDDASKLYLFYVRCSVQCYQQRSQEISTVVSSFTVRETP